MLERNEGSPVVLGVALVELLVLIAALLFVVLFLIERAIRNRLLALQRKTVFVINEGNLADCQALNAEIQEFNDDYSEQLNRTLPLVDCSKFE